MSSEENYLIYYLHWIDDINQYVGQYDKCICRVFNAEYSISSSLKSFRLVLKSHSNSVYLYHHTRHPRRVILEKHIPPIVPQHP